MQYKTCEKECNYYLLASRVPACICISYIHMHSPREVTVQKQREPACSEQVLVGLTRGYYRWSDLRDELLNRKPPLLKDNELICPHVGLHWELGRSLAVSLNIKEDKHWQIKHSAFIKNVATIPGVLLCLAKEVCGIADCRIASVASWHWLRNVSHLFLLEWSRSI